MSMINIFCLEKTRQARILQSILPSILFCWLIVHYYISIYHPSQIENLSKLHKIETKTAITTPNHRRNDKVIKQNVISRKLVQHFIVKPNNNEKPKPKIGRVHSACDLLQSRQPLDTKHVINNPDQFVNSVIPKTNCKTTVYLVVYVHSFMDNRLRRDTIRRTWGNVSQYDVPIHLVFVVGTSSGVKRSSKDALKNEIKIYGDIVQSNFIDNYHNLSHKAMGALKWIIKHCRSAKYVLKTDDDAFINMYLLLHLLRTKTNPGHNKENVLFCNVRNKSLGETSINRSGKWKITNKECNFNMKLFPTFCQGIAFVMTMNVAVALHDASKYVPLLWLDDVYLTGFLPALLRRKTAEHIDAGTFYMSTGNINKTTSKKILSGADVFKFIYYHEDDIKLYDTAWNNLKHSVTTHEFKHYSDALFSKDMQLERKRLKNITCTDWSRARDLCYIPPK